MADLPAGTAFGTLVHAVLEAADLTAPDLPAELRRCVRRRARPPPGARRSTPTRWPPRCVPVAAHPARPARRRAAGWPTSRRRDRLAELDFELPLAGGDTPAGATCRAAATSPPLLRRHLPADDPLAAYPDRLAGRSAAQPLRGYLTGSIDAVLRLPGPAVRRRRLQDQLARPIGPDGPSR